MDLKPEIQQESVIIIPAFNEEKNIGILISDIKTAFPEMDIVVVDDGSSDKTFKTAESNGATVLSHSSNMGYGITLQTGYKYVHPIEKYKFIIQIDADGQHNFQDIPALLMPLVNNEVDLVIGSRFLSKNSFKLGLLKKTGILFFRFLLYFFTKKRILDITSGFQVFNRKILTHYIQDDFPCYYADIDVLILVLKYGYSIKEVPTEMKPNQQGKSMHNGIVNQIYYVIVMILSTMVILMKDYRKKDAT